MLLQCTRLLIPGLIEFVAKMAPLVHDGTLTEPQSAAISEVWKAFVALFTSAKEENREYISDLSTDFFIDLFESGPRLLGVFLPTISLLLSTTAPSQPIAASLTTQTISQLLSFATSSPMAFKEALGKLDASTRELLEQCIRRAVGNSSASAAQVTAKPQISLRSF